LCADEGSHLVTINTEYQWLKNNFVDDIFWIGLDENVADRTWDIDEKSIEGAYAIFDLRFL
jgi:hypothetical protein